MKGSVFKKVLNETVPEYDPASIKSPPTSTISASGSYSCGISSWCSWISEKQRILIDSLGLCEERFALLQTHFCWNNNNKTKQKKKKTILKIFKILVKILIGHLSFQMILSLFCGYIYELFYFYIENISE